MKKCFCFLLFVLFVSTLLFAEGTYKSVTFTQAEADASIDMANHATFDFLRYTVGLTTTASNNIIAARPITTMEQLSKVSYVGTVSLNNIKEAAANWEVIGSVSSLDPIEEKLLLFVNCESVTAEEIDNIKYIGPAHASGIVNSRPLNTLAEISDATSSEGAAQIQIGSYQWNSILNYVQNWVAPDNADAGDETGENNYEPTVIRGIAFSGNEVGIVLDMANNASFDQLSNVIGLISTAANNIINYRENKTISSLEELDSISWVALSAFQSFKDYAPLWTGSSKSESDPETVSTQTGKGGTYDGVAFTDEEAVVALNLVNNADYEQLNSEVKLISTACNNIISARPITTMSQLEGVSYVGNSAMTNIKDYLQLWSGAENSDPEQVDDSEQGQTGQGGTYDGVNFTAQEVVIGLEICNTATAEQLTSGGVYATARNIIINNRPFENLDEVAATSGIATSTMNAILNMTSTWSGVELSTPTVSVQTLKNESITAATSSQYFDKTVQIERAIIISTPYSSSAGNVSFWIADPTAGLEQQLKVYIPSNYASQLNLSFASIYDDIKLTGVFTVYGSTWEIILEESGHTISQNVNGLKFEQYQTVQAAYKSTATNPEGVVRVVSSFDYTYMIPMPLFLSHPMWYDNPPSYPNQSGNVQDVNWNMEAQNTLNLWLQNN